jgi:predicted AAA+ superfamily ATPase
MAVLVFMDNDSIRYVIQDFVSRPLPEAASRDLHLPLNPGKVVGLTGIRRCGKTFLLYETMHRLVAQGVDRRRILYLNFEDDRLQPIPQDGKAYDLVLRCHGELYPDLAHESVYLFLDEVQEAPGWDRWVRRLQDTKRATVYCTGSASRVLTRDLSTALRGRSIRYEVLPLSFREVLRFRGLEPVPHLAESESQIRAALRDYLLWGGFPEVVQAAPEMRPLILQEYASVLYARDLIERYSLRNEKLLRALLRHCFRHTASLVSPLKLHRDMQSQGLTAAKNSVYEYLDILEESGLISLLPVWSESLRVQSQNPRKLHVVDTGLIQGFIVKKEPDLSNRLETAVYLEARRRLGPDWHYLRNGTEMDLCHADGSEVIHACWSLTDPETVRREQAAVEYGRTRFPGSVARLLYHEYGTAPAPRDVDPGAEEAWRWMLEGNGMPVGGEG